MSARTTHEKGDQVMTRTQQKLTKVLVPLVVRRSPLPVRMVRATGA
jgi:hypothetical protein